jgi:hypothetical protein
MALHQMCQGISCGRESNASASPMTHEVTDQVCQTTKESTYMMPYYASSHKRIDFSINTLYHTVDGIKRCRKIATSRANHASLWFLPCMHLEVGLFKQR